MKKKVLIIMTTAILTIGAVTAVYAKENISSNRFEAQAEAMENGNYKAMDDFMNNMTDEEYKKMIDIMKKNGYGNMASMMEGIGREEMIKMHNSMGGAAGCHGSDVNGNKIGMMRR